jgi:hypothetical protein
LSQSAEFWQVARSFGKLRGVLASCAELWQVARSLTQRSTGCVAARVTYPSRENAVGMITGGCDRSPSSDRATFKNRHLIILTTRSNRGAASHERSQTTWRSESAGEHKIGESPRSVGTSPTSSTTNVLYRLSECLGLQVLQRCHCSFVCLAGHGAASIDIGLYYPISDIRSTAAALSIR